MFINVLSFNTRPQTKYMKLLILSVI
jgi:hypothetical protein